MKRKILLNISTAALFAFSIQSYAVDGSYVVTNNSDSQCLCMVTHSATGTVPGQMIVSSGSYLGMFKSYVTPGSSGTIKTFDFYTASSNVVACVQAAECTPESSSNWSNAGSITFTLNLINGTNNEYTADINSATSIDKNLAFIPNSGTDLKKITVNYVGALQK
ncbi:MAG: hypothetical protein JSR33_03915 [Proteobacteria bacterium]|nr:hypothetical protein [Pseudomonadota bacterium]